MTILLSPVFEDSTEFRGFCAFGYQSTVSTNPPVGPFTKAACSLAKSLHSPPYGGRPETYCFSARAARQHAIHIADHRVEVSYGRHSKNWAPSNSCAVPASTTGISFQNADRNFRCSFLYSNMDTNDPGPGENAYAVQRNYSTRCPRSSPVR